MIATEGLFGLGRFSGSDGAFTGLVVGEAVAPLSCVRDDLSDRLSPVAVLARWDELAGDLSRAAGQIASGGPRGPAGRVAAAPHAGGAADSSWPPG